MTLEKTISVKRWDQSLYDQLLFMITGVGLFCNRSVAVVVHPNVRDLFIEWYGENYLTTSGTVVKTKWFGLKKYRVRVLIKPNKSEVDRLTEQINKSHKLPGNAYTTTLVSEKVVSEATIIIREEGE